MKVNKKYSYLLIPIGLVLFIQACTPQPKLQFQSTLKRDWKAPSTKNWENGAARTMDGHVVTRSESDLYYTIISYNRSGQKDGLWAKYHKNTHCGYEKRYQNGVLHGVSRECDVDTPYLNGKKEGTERRFRKNSYMLRSTPYRKGEKHGVEQIFSYTTGVLEKRITYDRGTQKKMEHYCKKKISLRTEMDGCRHGMEKAWYCGTGILERETPYNTCKRHGIEKVYDKQGNLIYTIPYFNGLREGTVKGYYPNGNLKYQVTYHADKVDELGYYYDMQGKKERIDYDTIIKFADRLPVSVEYWRL